MHCLILQAVMMTIFNLEKSLSNRIVPNIIVSFLITAYQIPGLISAPHTPISPELVTNIFKLSGHLYEIVISSHNRTVIGSKTGILAFRQKINY